LDIRIEAGVGVDPDLDRAFSVGRARIVPGHFPEAVSDEPPFDVITMLAVLEHIPPPQQAALAAACASALKPGGRVIITVPSPVVDRILPVLRSLRLIDGMSLEEHYGFDARRLPEVFQTSGFKLLRHRRFQLGLNHLFVFGLDEQAVPLQPPQPQR
jgi:SAM-dependent methyltransferase